MPLPQAAVRCMHARPILNHQGGDGGLSVWFFRGVVGCLMRIRLVFGVSSLIPHFKIAFVTRTLHPTAPWPRRHSRRAARGPPRLSWASWRRGRRTNGLLPSGLVQIDRRGETPRPVGGFVRFPPRVPVACAPLVPQISKKSMRRQNYKFLVVSYKAELQGIPEGGVGRPNPQIRT